MKLLGDGSELGVKLTYTIQPVSKGIAYSIQDARNLLENDKFLVILGDNFFSQPLLDEARFFYSSKFHALVYATSSSHPERYGVMKFQTRYDLGSSQEVKELVSVVEKPKEYISNSIMIGAYFFTPKFFDAFRDLKPSQRGEYEITDIINKLLPNVAYRDYEHTWFDLGVPDDILECAKHLQGISARREH
jgi:glucose-1-phosphate thymidylyltransferase